MENKKIIPMLKNVLTIAIALLMLCSVSAQAEEVYPDVEEIPDVLKKGIRQGKFIEQYINSQLNDIRSYARTQLALDQKDIDDFIFRETEFTRKRYVWKILQFDNNGDAQITTDELKIGLNASYNNREQRINNLDKDVKKYQEDKDINKDGIITLKEIMNNWQPRDYFDKKNLTGRNIPYRLSELLALDPNNDGKLEAIELEIIARKAFNTVDANNDGILSKDEYDIPPFRRIISVE